MATAGDSLTEESQETLESLPSKTEDSSSLPSKDSSPLKRSKSRESLGKKSTKEKRGTTKDKKNGSKGTKGSKSTSSKESGSLGSKDLESEARSKEVACLIVDFDINAPPEGMEEDEFFDIPDSAAARIADLKAELAKPHSALWLRLKDRLERAIGGDAIKTYEVPEVARPQPKTKYKMEFTIQDELNLREAPKDTGNAYFMKGFSSQTAPFMGVRPNLLPVISQDKVTIDKAMLPALYQPFRKEREHPYGLEEPSVLHPRGVLKQPPEVEERIFKLVTQQVPEPGATLVPRTFEKVQPPRRGP